MPRRFDRQAMNREIDKEFCDGYVDGRNTDTPGAGPNRSAAYRHSFEVGRAERNDQPIPAAVSRQKAHVICVDAGACPISGCSGMLEFDRYAAPHCPECKWFPA